MKTVFITLVCLLSTLATFGQEAIKVLIVDGQNNHDHWPKITYLLKESMEVTGLFAVDVTRTKYTWKGEEFLDDFTVEGVGETTALDEPKPDPGYSPDFAAYDAVVCNFGWKASPWPHETQRAFEEYIEAGGGLVVFHAADNSFPRWKAYNRMIGLGGWGGRDEKDGPMVYYNKAGELVRDTIPGKGGEHGPQSEYQIQIRNSDHPITRGMPEVWMHTQDELYNSLRGPAEDMEVLATAYADPKNKGTDRHEPALMTLTYGKGHIFHNIMGHADYSVACVGFLTSMLRGTEWVATGEVTQEIPADFPTAEASSIREDMVKR